MLALARYALKSPFHAATVVGLLGLLSLIIPPVSILSGAVVGLIILTQGLYAGARSIVLAIAGISIISFLVMNSAILGVSIGLVQWLPVIVLAELLRRSRSLSLTLAIGMIVGYVAVALQFLIWPESESVMIQMLGEMLPNANLDAEQRVEMQNFTSAVVHWMVLSLVAAMYAVFVATLMLARWLQAKIADSAGFRDEFHVLKLGKLFAVLGLVIVVTAVLTQIDWIMAMMIVTLGAFLYQGLAIAHRASASVGHKAWLVGLYILMFLFPHVVVLTAVVGLVDNWVDLRAKLKSIPEKSENE